MESVKTFDKAEIEMWKAFQQRFKLALGQFETEMATMHGNSCTARPGNVASASARQKLGCWKKK